MPTKTPLLGALRSFFRDAQIAKAHAVSIDALREIRAIHAERAGRRGVSRRTFLTTAGVAAAASVVPRVSLAARAPTVVIVGGGIAGLNCALELADVGIRSTGVRSVGADRRTNVFESQLLGRESGHRVVRRTDRHEPYDCQEVGQALRFAPGQPARRPAAAVRRHLPLLRPVLREKPGRSGFRCCGRHHCRRRGGGRVSDNLRLQHGGGSSPGSPERLRLHRAPHPGGPSLTARSPPGRGLRH